MELLANRRSAAQLVLFGILAVVCSNSASGQTPPWPVPAQTGSSSTALSAATSGSGPTMSWQYYAYGGPYIFGSGQTGGTFVANGGVVGTFVGGTPDLYFNIIADSTSITFDYSIYNGATAAIWSDSALSLPPTIHNGIAIDMLSGGTFSSVTINSATNMVGFDASRISFTGSQIQVDWQNLPFNTGTIVRLDFTLGCSTNEQCDDNNPCTDDSCNPASGCVHDNNAAPCDDGNACTSNDTCGGGMCHSGGPTNCDDADCCTIDACDPATGCAHAANTAAPVFFKQPAFGNTILWPPQHGYADFTVASTGAAATSSCGIASLQFASCASSQPENGTGTGDGNSVRDCVYEPGALHLRAERDGACSPIGRVYTTTVVAVDLCGNSTTSNAFTVGVWHDRNNAPAAGTIVHAVGGTSDTRNGNNGTYGLDCGVGNADVNGTVQDHSDADPDTEVSQSAAIDVNSLVLTKVAGDVTLNWTAPQYVAPINVTRYHVYRLDPVTLFWTLVAEVTKAVTSYQDPILNDGHNWQYRITAVIK
jgi:hypothetical protein